MRLILTYAPCSYLLSVPFPNSLPIPVQFLVIFILFNLVNLIGKQYLTTFYVFTSLIASELEQLLNMCWTYIFLLLWITHAFPTPISILDFCLCLTNLLILIFCPKYTLRYSSNWLLLTLFVMSLFNISIAVKIGLKQLCGEAIFGNWKVWQWEEIIQCFPLVTKVLPKGNGNLLITHTSSVIICWKQSTSLYSILY